MSDSSPFNPLPRGEIFHSPAAKIVWAAVLALPAAAQFELLTQLQLRLASADTKADAHDLRVAGAQTALREVAALLGHSPSVDEYRTARKKHPERNWPADSSIRRILGGSWNVALRSTHLQTVAGGDMVIASLGPLFQASELIAAVRQCTEAIGGVPSLHRYLGWAKRPDVRVLPGRRPTSQQPFERAFGSWLKALVAAELVDGSNPAVIGWDTPDRPRVVRLTDEGATQVLHEVKERLGHVPRLREYQAERERMLCEAQDARTPRAIPSANALQRRYGTWAEALCVAGLEPGSGRRHGKGGPKGPRTSDDECLAILREAYAACGSPFTVKVYMAWRKAEMQNAGKRRLLPSYERFHSGWPTWWDACQAAFGGDERTSPADGREQWRRDAKPRGRHKPPADASGDVDRPGGKSDA
jgi:HNH endonuclease